MFKVIKLTFNASTGKTRETTVATKNEDAAREMCAKLNEKSFGKGDFDVNTKEFTSYKVSPAYEGRATLRS